MSMNIIEPDKWFYYFIFIFSYVTDVLLEGASEENLKNTIYQIKRG